MVRIYVKAYIPMEASPAFKEDIQSRSTYLLTDADLKHPERALQSVIDDFVRNDFQTRAGKTKFPKKFMGKEYEVVKTEEVPKPRGRRVFEVVAKGRRHTITVSRYRIHRKPISRYRDVKTGRFVSMKGEVTGTRLQEVV